ncbi:lactaldehyde reductase [Mycoplasmopsis alligatoris]|uniref:Lactaldehyde reductase n=1 Tax=Mycoplasmopsis alligatoris A21JP2 TaxID=747682 RepID=D4XWF5_9BACT|nr:lactaldehyde reductase [Mycoplasmopsis alligatoris]EFF41119.1 lactaldehyde reductase [Mycoplasmopsis alligatoris A21JP2]
MANRMVLNPVSYFGRNSRQNIVTEVQKRKLNHAFICTDKSIVEHKVLDLVTDVLKANNLTFTVFDNVEANPTIENIQAGVEAFKKSKADYILTVGGGSALDTAKGIGIIITNPEFYDVRSLEGLSPTKNRAIFTIAVPTTAGTASEVTMNYVVTDNEKHRKFVCVDPNDVPEVAIVDADMTSTMPAGLAKASGMDALTHAIEGYITKGATIMSDMLHIKSIELIAHNLEKAVKGDKDARDNMILASYVAGMGYSNVGLGIVHSMSHPLSAYYKMAHGIANAILLPTVMEFNAQYSGEKYKDIAVAFGVKNTEKMSQDEYRKAAVNAVRQLSLNLEIPQSLVGLMKPEDLEKISQSALSDVCTGGNPRDVNLEDIKTLYKKLLK